MTFSIVTTADGSVSCLDSETGEICHNKVGAYTEALQNYVEPSKALQTLGKTGELTLLDACYGLGYNTWAVLNEAVKTIQSPFTFRAVAIEKNPDILQYLPLIFEHPSFDALKNQNSLIEHNIDYRTLMCSKNTKGPQQITIPISEEQTFHLELWVDDLRKIVPSLRQNFDLVFHDPFSPSKMPELWSVDLFRLYHLLLQDRNGRFLTYSAASAVRGGLVEAGFTIGRTVALGAKQGGTIGLIEGIPEEPLKPEEVQYMETRAGLPYRDPQLNTDRAIIVANRQHEQSLSARLPGNAIRNRIR